MSKQTKSKDPQQINFTGKIEGQDHGATMFFIIEESEETTFKIFPKFCKHLIKMETQKIVNLLNSSGNEFSKLAIQKWYIIDSETKDSYSHHDPIKSLTGSLESSLYDYSDAYVLVTGYIAVKNANDVNITAAAKVILCTI